MVVRIGICKCRRLLQVGWQKSLSSRYSGLHVGRGVAEALIQRELQDQGRLTGLIGRSHQIETWDLQKLFFQRRRYRIGHRLGTGARITYADLDYRVVDCGQIVHRKLSENLHTEQRETDRQKQRHNRTPDAKFGNVHKAGLGLAGGSTLPLESPECWLWVRPLADGDPPGIPPR